MQSVGWTRLRWTMTEILSPSHRDTLHQAQAILNRTLSIEEAFWKQKAGARWTYSVAGPDGFSSHFFQVCWDIVSEDVFQAVLDFFAGGHLPKDFVATSVVLLPKRDNASPQSGFISRRLIGDNVLLAQELLHTLDTKVRGGNVILKLDMAKAYDRMDWNFLISIMEGFGFDALWIDRIRRCISECRFSILINGRPCGFFSSSRGLRQVDPISPSLFIIAADYFSRLLIQQYQHIPSMAYIHVGDALISHLSFADDMIIFVNGQKQFVRRVLQCIEHYEGASGLWDSRDNALRLHWKRWKDLCIPTVEGGLGFRRLQDLVDTLSLKLWWLFRSQRSLWAQFLLSKYCKDTHPLLTTIPYNASTVWKRLKHIGQQAETHIAWQLGRGQIFFWHDCWMGESTLADQHPHLTHSSIQVRELFDDTGWNISRLLQLVPYIILEQIGDIPITAEVQDQIMWKDTSDGRFATKSSWQLVRTGHTIQAVYEGFQYRFQSWRFSGQFVRQGHIRTIVPLLILWFTWIARNDAKIPGYLYGTETDHLESVSHYLSTTYVPFISGYSLAWRYGYYSSIWYLSYYSIPTSFLFWFIGVLHQGDLTRSTLMDASKMDLRVEEGLLEIHQRIVLSDLWIEADSTLAIHCITRGGGPWSIQAILRHIRHLLTFDHDTISHIYREGNQVADLLALEGWDRRCYFEYNA
ncbi:Uncharacterized protein Adt_19503 [Abeliophyllum distichum]|uniref:Reverse transcriptase domain-containing protein n=1 Tax=Abeliophyllum distichum TaxID=126358 RepID=A0ABD1ST49_9LAMI